MTMSYAYLRWLSGAKPEHCCASRVARSGSAGTEAYDQHSFGQLRTKTNLLGLDSVLLEPRSTSVDFCRVCSCAVGRPRHSIPGDGDCDELAGLKRHPAAGDATNDGV
jgi:hypothetical protein